MNFFHHRLLPIPALLRRSLAGAASLLPGLALANPTGGQVVSGQVSITTPNANGMVVTEATNSAIVNWQSFSIGGQEYVQFIQPSSSSVILNRVIGNSPSSIFGSLTANGRVFLINPEGVLFAPGSTVDVGALVASTVDISNSDFLAGHYVFANGKSGTGITNNGIITAHGGGFVVLNGDYVHNSGVIQAQLGEVVLASGSAMTLTIDQGGLIGYSVDQAALSQQAGVTNSGQLLTDGGHIIMTAEVAHNLVSTAINNTGLVRAEGIASHDGIVELTAQGGDIEQAGTIDVQNPTAQGGGVQVITDQNIDLAAGARILASGDTGGGSIKLVADGKLSTAAASLIDAHASAGNAGDVEISGHHQTLIRGAITIGRGGSLSIDPTNVVIGSSDAATVTPTQLESLLKTGTSESYTASNDVVVNTLPGGLLDGRNNGAGGGLTLVSTNGSIIFEQQNDGIAVDGNLNFTAHNGIIVGNLTAGRMNLSAGGAISTGDLSANKGNITVTSVGSIKTGNITVSNNSGSASRLTLESSNGSTLANGDITVNGSINVTGGGGTSRNSGSNVMADVEMKTNGNVNVTGYISVSGNSFSRSYSTDGGTSITNSAGSAKINIQGKNITLSGANVQGIGNASFVASASQSITIDGGVTVTATRANFTSSGANHAVNSAGGLAVILLKPTTNSSDAAAALSITTYGLSATGPNAAVSVYGGNLNLNNGGSGYAVNVQALAVGTGAGNSYTYNNGGIQQVKTNFGAGAAIINRAGGGSTNIGNISVSGPSALLSLVGSSGVTTVNGNLSVNATGYSISGDATQFPLFVQAPAPINGGGILQQAAMELKPPVLVNGHTQWGAAIFTAGGSSNNVSDTLSVNGSLTVSGVGQARVAINAATLNVGGGLSVTAGKGSLLGSYVSNYRSSSDSAGFNVTRRISSTAGSSQAATFGQANVTVRIGNSNGMVGLGSLNVRGLSAQASFNGGRSLTVFGSVTVDGQYGGVAPDFKEVAVGSGQTGGSTQWVGDVNYLRIGSSDGGAISNVQLGDVNLGGFGFVDLAIYGQSVSLGNVTVTQGTGLFTSTDNTRYSNTYSVSDQTSVKPGTSILISASGPVQAGSLTVNSVDPVAQQLNAAISGSYSITAPSFVSIVSGVDQLTHPLLTPPPISALNRTFVPENKTIGGVTVSAGDITINIGGNLSLASSSYHYSASDKLSITTGGSLTLSNTTLTAGNSLSLNAGSTFSDSSSRLIGKAVAINAAGTLNLNNTTIIGSTGGARGTISLTANTVNLNQGLSLTGTDITISATSSDLTLSGNIIDASSALNLTATGAIDASNSSLLGDVTTLTAQNGISLTGTTLAGSGGQTPSTRITLTAGNGAITLNNNTVARGVTVDFAGTGILSNASASTPSISATNLTLDATASDLNITSALALSVTQNLVLESQTGSVSVARDLSVGGGITLDAAAGSVTALNLSAGASININAQGAVSVGALSVGLASNGEALNIQGSQITTGNILNNTPTGTIGPANDMVLTATAGGITTGNITTSVSGSTTAFLTVDATGGAISIGNVSVEGLQLASSGNITLGAVSLQSPTPPASTITSSDGTVTLASLSGNVPLTITSAGNATISGGATTTAALAITSTGGNIQTGDVTGGTTIDFNAATGTITTGNLETTATVQDAVTLAANGDITTGTIAANGINLASQAGNITTSDLTIGSGDLGLNIFDAGSITAGNVTYQGDAVFNETNLNITLGNVSAHSLSITENGGTVALGNLNTTGDIALTMTGASLSLGNATAGGNFSLFTDQTLTLANQTFAAAGVLSIEGDGGINATNTSLSGSAINLLSNGSIGLTDSTLAGPVSDTTASPASTIALSAGGNITLTGNTRIVGDAVGLFSAQSVTSASDTNGNSTITAGALSVQAFNTIDLTQTTLKIGTGTAQFGIDAQLLNDISKQSMGKIPVPSGGPNAAFKGQIVNLGTIETQTPGDDLYLYIESQATSSGLGYSIAQIQGAGNALLDYNLYSGNTQVVNLPAGAPINPQNSGSPTAPGSLTIDGAVNAPPGLTTLVIGSSTLASNIVVNTDAAFTPNNPAAVNLVFATSGQVTGANNLHTTGYVLILGGMISASNPFDPQLPINPNDYTPPSTSGLDSPQSSLGDPDDPGVNSANKGTIVEQTSTQGALTSCSGT